MYSHKTKFFLCFRCCLSVLFSQAPWLYENFWINIIPVIIGTIVMLGESYMLYVITGLDDSGAGLAISLFTI